jgi:hypothetical protein
VGQEVDKDAYATCGYLFRIFLTDKARIMKLSHSESGFFPPDSVRSGGVRCMQCERWLCVFSVLHGM